MAIFARLFYMVKGAPAVRQTPRGLAEPDKRSCMENRTCSVEDCLNPARARGWCNKHLLRWRKYGDPQGGVRVWYAGTCSVNGCDRTANEPGGARSWCRNHYRHWKRHGDPEASASCARCGAPMAVGRKSAYCRTNPECKSLYRASFRVRRPKRSPMDPEERRARRKRALMRTDRECVRPGCEEFAVTQIAYCRRHNLERGNRRYARKRLRIPRMLYIRQVGLCPDREHGGCGLPLGDPDGNHVDHLVPEVQNGPDAEWNLQLMHPECNMRKSDSLVPAALVVAKKHGLMLARPSGSRPRSKVAA